jgi:hypothetical protein
MIYSNEMEDKGLSDFFRESGAINGLARLLSNLLHPLVKYLQTSGSPRHSPTLRESGGEMRNPIAHGTANYPTEPCAPIRIHELPRSH